MQIEPKRLPMLFHKAAVLPFASLGEYVQQIEPKRLPMLFHKANGLQHKQ